MTDEQHERLRDDLAAYALDALEDPEAAALERHLEECESCRVRLRWLRPAVDVLPASVEQRIPPERLREELLATVRAEAGAPADEPGKVRRGAAATRPVRRRWHRFRALALRPATGLAAVLLLVTGAGAGYILRGGSDDDPVANVLDAEARGGVAGEVSATLEREGDSATLHVQELPRLGRDAVYEVWVQRAGTIDPASLFVLRDDGTAEAAVPGPLGDAEAVLVTREPRGGSDRPTTAPVLEVALE